MRAEKKKITKSFTGEKKHDSKKKQQKKKSLLKIYKKILQRRADTVEREGFKDVMKMKMEVFICNSKDEGGMQEKCGRFDLTSLKSQETDTFIARG